MKFQICTNLIKKGGDMRKAIIISFLVLTAFLLQGRAGQDMKAFDVRGTTGSQTVQAQRFGSLPLYFIPNQGQAHEKARFYAQTPGYTLWMTSEGFVFDSIRFDAGEERESGKERNITRLKFLQANADPVIKPLQLTDYRVNYFIGEDKSKWVSNISASKAVLYENLYPGIDLKVYGKEKEIEYDWIAAPQAEPGIIMFTVQGDKDAVLDDSGNLVMHTRFGEIKHSKPHAYQIIDKEKITVTVNFRQIDENIFGFKVDSYDPNHPLIIDPVLALDYSTFIGGSGGDWSRGIFVDDSGCAYIIGRTGSSDFPMENAYEGSIAGSTDVFISKFSSDGSSLQYSTYLGGTDMDIGEEIAVDSSGCAYVTGYTDSDDFPVVNAYQPARGGNWDAFVTKLSSAGSSVLYSTYLGGTDSDIGHDIAVDSTNNAHITGETESNDFPVVSAYQSTRNGDRDAFITKFNSVGDTLTFSTYFGGGNNEKGYGIALDTNTNIYLTGETYSADFPLKDAYQSTHGGGYIDAFVTKFNSSASTLQYSTYLGGDDMDEGRAIDVDSSFCAYVAGGTKSSNFPTESPYQGSYGGGYDDAFVAKVNSSGQTLGYSTYLGGSNYDTAEDIAVDSSGSAHVTGYTDSGNFPTVNAFQPSHSDPGYSWDAFYAEFLPDGSAPAYSTFLGGGTYDVGWGVALDSSACAYVTGYTESGNFPTADPFQPSRGGGRDAFVTKFFVCYDVESFNLLSPSDAATDQNVDVDLDWEDAANAESYDLYFGNVSPPSFEANVTASEYDPGTLPYEEEFFWYVKAKNACSEYDSEEWRFTTTQAPSISIDGYVTSEGTGLAGVSMTGLPSAPATSGTGYYSDTLDSGWSGTVTPALTGYSFTPESRTYTNETSDLLDENYTAELNTYTITGTVTSGGSGLSGVTITGLPSAPVTITDGTYSDTVNHGWGGTAAPALPGYTFSPSSIPYSNVTSDQTGEDYTASLISLTISGTVTEDGSPFRYGAAMIGLPSNPVSGIDGTYSDNVNYGWSGTVTPTYPGYSFSPEYRNYTNVTADQTNQDYTAFGGYYNSPSDYQVIPEVLWAPATGGGTWMTEVQITDVTGGSEVSLYFNSATGERRGPIALFTGSGPDTSVKTVNLLNTLDQLDPGFDYYGQVGAVEFTTHDPDHKIHVIAKTKNGNYSKTFPGLNYNADNTVGGGRVMMIQNLANNDTFRTAYGGFNIKDESVTVEYKLIAGDGSTIGTPFNKTFSAYQYQAVNIFDEAGVPYPTYSFDNVWLKITYLSGDGKLMSYGATANNATSDPAVHIAVQAQDIDGYNSPSSYQVIPEVLWAPATGGGTWMTEVQITDITGGSEVSVYYNAATGERRGPITLFTGSGPDVSGRAANLLAVLDALDTGFDYYSTVGTVEFVTQDADHKIQVIARTANGNYSKTFQGLNLNDANTASADRTLMVQNLVNDDTYRTAFGGFNPTDDDVTVEFTLMDENGSTVGTSFSKTFTGRQYQAFNPFTEAGVAYPGNSYNNTWIKVAVTSGSGQLMVYGATANNITSDPAVHRAVQH
jgi:hypothetical protein